MPQKDTNPHDKNHSAKVKRGIERARARKGKWGRPTVVELKGDPNLAARASEMRTHGLSWSRIATELGIGRSTARRLVNVGQKDVNSHNEFQADLDVPNRSLSSICQKDKSEHSMDPSNADNVCIEGALEKSKVNTVSEGSEKMRGLTENRIEFIRVALQLVLESEHLTKQVLEKIIPSRVT